MRQSFPTHTTTPRPTKSVPPPPTGGAGPGAGLGAGLGTGPGTAARRGLGTVTRGATGSTEQPDSSSHPARPPFVVVAPTPTLVVTAAAEQQGRLDRPPVRTPLYLRDRDAALARTPRIAASNASANANRLVVSTRPLTSRPAQPPRSPRASRPARPPVAPRSPRSPSSPQSPRSPTSPTSPTSPPLSFSSSLSSFSSASSTLSSTSSAKRTAQMRNLRVAPSPPSTMAFDNTPRKPTLAARSGNNAATSAGSSGSSGSTASTARAPLTPKIAASATTASVATPLARRSTLGTASNARDARDDLAHLAHNVTPRSGSRQNRVDGSTYSPTGSGNTPSVAGLGDRPRHVAASTVSSTALADSKFFYASDVRPSASLQQPPQPPQPSQPSQPSHPSQPSLPSHPSQPSQPTQPSLASTPRSSAFFYANGRSLPDVQPAALQQPPATPLYHPPASTVAPSDISSKFIHANGAAPDRPHPPPLKAAAGPTSSVQAVASPKLSMSRSSSTYSSSAAASRPMSPAKMPLAASPYPPLQKSVNFSPSPRSQTPSSSAGLTSSSASSGLAPANAVTAGSVRTRKRNSTGSGSGSSTIAGLGRKGSISIADPPVVTRRLQSSAHSRSEASSPAAAHFPSAAQLSPFAFPAFGPAAVNGRSTPPTAATSLAAILQATDELAEPDDEDDDDGNDDGDNDEDESRHSNVSNNSNSSNSSAAQELRVDSLVVTARRERKVQDLEITNASLEAINRSLERQLRKQKSELRQFRRLSRSGRLSLAPSTASAGIVSGSIVEGALEPPDRSDDDDAFEDADEFRSDGEAGAEKTETTEKTEKTENTETPEKPEKKRKKEKKAKAGGKTAAASAAADAAALAVDGERHGDASETRDTSGSGSGTESESESDEHGSHEQRRDRRLQLDLSKHRQLLVDSQKINQSIKRCLSWTDELIQEGRKALAFRVRVSEIQLGGRVLMADELEEDGDEDEEVDDEVDEIDEVEKDKTVTVDARADDQDASTSLLTINGDGSPSHHSSLALEPVSVAIYDGDMADVADKTKGRKSSDAVSLTGNPRLDSRFVRFDIDVDVGPKAGIDRDHVTDNVDASSIAPKPAIATASNDAEPA